MNLIQLIEMLCDWKAATMRHNDGDPEPIKPFDQWMIFKGDVAQWGTNGEDEEKSWEMFRGLDDYDLCSEQSEWIKQHAQQGYTARRVTCTVEE